MAKVVMRSNVLRAIDRVEKNKGAPGIDGMKTSELRGYLNENRMENWKRIRGELLDGRYRPLPLRRKSIPKPGGGERTLGIPSVIDRMIQQAITQVLTEILDPSFSDSSFGFRPGRSAHQAVREARNYIEQGYRVVVDMDLEKFFDRVNHDVLMGLLANRIQDKVLLKTIRSFLKAGAMEKGCCVRTDEGTPQGGPLSPLLANVMLDILDRELESRGHRFARYADDCNIYVKSRRAGERVFESVRRFLETRLRLKVNEKKSAVDRPWKRKFLGFSFNRRKKTKIRVSPESLRRFKLEMKRLTRRNWGSITMKDRISRINRYIRGWSCYYGLADTPTVFRKLDKWIRRRLRACVLKQWKNERTIHRKLISMGLERHWAARVSYSSKGIWRISRTPQLSAAMGIDYWFSLGLKSVTDCCCQ